MKKKPHVLMTFLILILATLACRLPTFIRPDESAEVVTEIVEEAIPTEAEEEEEPFYPEETEPEAETTELTAVYSGTGVQITLPSTYVLGDVDNDLAILMEGLQKMSEEHSDDIQKLYEKNKEDILLWGYNTDNPINHQTSLVIMKNEEFAGMSLAIISTFAKVLLGSEVSTIEQERLTLNEYDALRFRTTAEASGVKTAQVIYLFNESDKLWLIGFFTTSDQLEAHLPVFDAAVASFVVLPVD